MSESFDLTEPDNFVAGTVGEPGERIFYLQGRQGGELVTLKAEKGQIQALASYLAEVLETHHEGVAPIAPTNMEEPPMAAWTVGGLGIGLDESGGKVVVMAEELVDDEDETPADARFHLRPEQAKGYIDHALFLIEYGRDFGRQNGHRPHD